jgi:hypothetical protein
MAVIDLIASHSAHIISMRDGPFRVEEQHRLVRDQKLFLVSLRRDVGPSRIQHPLGDRYELVPIGHDCSVDLLDADLFASPNKA